MNPSVKTGQAQTDVGLIPMDWNITRIDAHCSIKTGSRNTQDKVEGGAYPFYVRSQQVERINSYSYDGEAVLTAGDGVGTGKVFHYINGKFDVHQRVYRISDFSDHLHGRYFFYQFSTRFYERIMSMTAKSSVDSVRMEMIAGMQIPLPPVHEQAAIASALDDIDALLSSLDQLVAKKRDIQQATMQQLLTGQRRLPGFSGKWLAVKARDIGLFRGGSGFPNRFQGEASGAFPFYKVSDMNNEGNEIFMSTANNYIAEDVRKAIGAVIFPANSIVFAKVGAAVFLERKKILTTPSCLDNNMAAFIVDERRVCVRFMHYSLLNIRLGDLVSTTALPSLSNPVLSSIEITLPPISEQQAIATILSDIDAELATLETRRVKALQLKLGMMQELLTGRIRLT